MEAGVSGYFDIVGTEKFTGRFFYSEEYDKTNGKRVVKITGISIQSTVYGGTWYPGGTVEMDGEVLQTMTYEGRTTHTVSVGASANWHNVSALGEDGAFPWVSSEITSNTDGSRSVTFTIDLTLWRATDSWKIYIKGSHVVELSNVPVGLVYIDNGDSYDMCQAFIDTGTEWVQLIPYMDTGSEYVICS